MYETFEHTADLGIRIRAGDLLSLFAEAGKAFFSVIVDNPEEIQGKEQRKLTITGSDTDYLLFDWLNELLFLFETEHILISEFDVTLTETGLEAVVRGETVCPERHRLSHEVKAITYHHLHVEETKQGWLAEVILDI